MSIERRVVLRAFGAKLVLTDGAKGMRGAIERTNQLVDEIPGGLLLQQFRNPANPAVHRSTTAEEIWADTDGSVDALIAGVGTGGTLTGVASVLKARRPRFEAIAVEPTASAVLSGGAPGPHEIQGIGAGFVPDVLDRTLIDRVIGIGNEEAFNVARGSRARRGCTTGASAREALLGPVRARIFTRFAQPNGEGPGANARIPAAMILRLLRIAITARLRGDHRRSPFFDSATGEPIANPRLLGDDDLRRARAGGTT